MADKRLIIAVLAIVAMLSITIFSETGITGFTIKEKEVCRPLFQQVGELCASGASTDCTFARHELEQCRAKVAAIKKQPKPQYQEECNFKATGNLRCSNPQGDVTVKPHVMKELRDKDNKNCNAQWVFSKFCTDGTQCKRGKCMEKTCSRFRDCDFGKACEDGYCKQLCKDSDGLNTFTKGVGKSYRSDDRLEEDYCFNDKYVIEWFCDGDFDPNRPGVHYLNYRKLRCTDGCFNGKCVQKG